MESLRKRFQEWDTNLFKKKNKWVNLIALLIIAGCSGLIGWGYGIYQGTGTWPGEGTEAIYPEIEETTASADFDTWLEKDKSQMEFYREGYNCVEFALMAARSAHWEGIPAEIIRLNFEDETGHLLLAFPVEGEWRFIDMQTHREIFPRTGGRFVDHVIIGVDKLAIIWEPFEVPAEEKKGCCGK